jgi:hypothetical protein
MLIKGNKNQMCGETPTKLRMGVPTNFDGFSAALSETHPEAAINAHDQSCQEARILEERPEMQPQPLRMLGINAKSYNGFVWITTQLSRTLNNSRLNRKQQPSIPDSFNSLVAENRKMSLLPNRSSGMAQIKPCLNLRKDP